MLLKKLVLPMAGLVLLAWSIAAQAGPISGCVDNGNGTQTCTLYETNAHGNFSEISSPITNLFGNTWTPFVGQLLEGPDGDNPGAISDLIVFTTNSAIMFSDGTPEFDFLLANSNFGGTELRTEAGPDESGSPFTQGNDLIITLSGVPADVPEPATLPLLATGLVGLHAAFFWRRRPRAA